MTAVRNREVARPQPVAAGSLVAQFAGPRGECSWGGRLPPGTTTLPQPVVDVPAAGRALGKHEEFGTRCTCGAGALRLRSNHGELVPVRGGCVNKCDYCAKLAAVENCEMLVLDALAGDAPQLVAILGTRTATVDMAAFKRGRQEVARAVRRRWPDAEYAYEVEFTSGYGPRSGGKRRPHWNWFWKGIPRHDWWVASWVIVTAWCRNVDAEPGAQYVDLIRNEVGLTKYITEHFMKASQRPPAGFAGSRFCASRGYFRGTTVTVARQRARESLRFKRELWKAELRGVADAHERELAAREAVELAARTVWVLATDRGARLSGVQHDERRDALRRDRRWREPELLVTYRLLLEQLARDAAEDQVGCDEQPADVAVGEQGILAVEHEGYNGKRSGPL